MFGLIGAGQMRHDAAGVQRALGHPATQRGNQVREVRGGHAAAVESGVRLDRHGGGGAGLARGGQHLVELAPRGHPDLHVGGHGRGEVGARGVQPGQYRGRDARRAQRQGLLDGGDTEFGGAGAQRGARHLGGAVPVAVGLHDDHHLC